MLLDDAHVRLITLTGPGGVGKTRLALELVSGLAGKSNVAGGVVFVELASVRDADLVLPTIAQALDLREQRQEPAATVLATFLRGRRVLLVLDNFEQVVTAGPKVTDLLRSCPDLRVLVTSRSQLHVTGEHVVTVPPLAVPPCVPSAVEHTGDAPAVSEAATLFIQRAQAVRIDFALTPATSATVEEICRRLDGLPLAIELVAARCTVFTPQVLLTRLDRRLPLLTRGQRDAPARHQTMRDAIAWSYDLLTADERAVFRSLSVFNGGCTLEAAETVCTLPDAVDVIESLARQSLLQIVDPAGDDGAGPRLILLETVREFAAEQLASDEEQAVRRRHAAYYREMAARAEPADWGDEAGEGKAAIEFELGNLRAALTWATVHGETDTALDLASTMFDPNWMTGDNAREQESWSRRALALPGGTPVNRVKALTSAAWLANAYFDFEHGRTLVEEASELARRHGDAFGLAWAAFVRGHAAFHEGDLVRARCQLTDAVAGLRTLNCRGRVAWANCYLASLDSRDAVDEDGDAAGLARAAGLYEEALAVFRGAGHLRGTARALHGLAYVAYQQRDLPRALSCTREVLALDWEHGWPVYHYLEDIADIAGRIGRPKAAARLYGAAHRQRERVGRPVEPVYRAEFERDMAVSVRELGDAAFAAAWAAGAVLTPEQAVAEALDPALMVAVAERPDATGPVSPLTTPLTERQAQILPLLAAGQTDREIAAALFLSPRTVEHHVARIAERLGVRSRAAIVRSAHDAGLISPPTRSPND